ncbi:MAG: hypothetical protein NTW96_16855 [Planctomycetia bacterium]|nr:hypothetical protein [Planctomycetia bacterium]
MPTVNVAAICDDLGNRFRAVARIAFRCVWGYVLIVGPLWLAIGTCLIATGIPAVAAEPPVVAVLVRPDAPELDRHAAGELCGYLKKLYGSNSMPAENPGADAEIVFLIGSPTTNPAVAKALGPGGWPEVSDQGIVLKRADVDGKPALVVGGGSPKATLWAVYELVSRWGVRYLLHGDVFPESPGTLRLPEEDVVLEPKLRVRQWRVINDFACGPESWGMVDYRPVLDQLAKLKFNRVFLSIWTYQPFLHFEHKGVKRQSAWLWFKYRYPITDDMIGRQLFDNRPEFWNPDLPYGTGYEELAAAGERLVHELMAHAHGRGMQCVMTANPLEYPTEFAPLLADSQPIRQLGGETIVPGPKLPPDDPGLTDLATAVLRATVNTYPEVDYLLLCMPEHRQWESLDEQAWNALDAKYDLGRITSLDQMLAAAAQRPDVPGGAERAVREVKGDLVMLRFYDRLLSECHALEGTKRPDMKFIYCAVAEELFPVLPRILPPGSETLNFLAYTPARVVKRREAIARLDTRTVPATLIFTLHDDNIGLLPALTTGSLHELTKDLRRHGWAGFSTRYWLIGDHDPCVAYLAQAAWDAAATPEGVYRDHVRAACGEAAVPDMLAMFEAVEKTSILLEWDGLGLGFPVPDMMMKHAQPGPMPEYCVEARRGYQNALEAAHRARQKTPDGRAGYIDYWIGRLEFGVGYFDAIDAMHRGATAEQAGQRAEAIQRADEALAHARAALESYARTARDRSDYGGIAVMNEYVYRPLREKAAGLKQK